MEFSEIVTNKPTSGDEDKVAEEADKVQCDANPSCEDGQDVQNSDFEKVLLTNSLS